MEARVDDALVNRRGRGPSSGLHNPLPSDWLNACYFPPADSTTRHHSKTVRYAECFYVVEYVSLLWGVRFNVQEIAVEVAGRALQRLSASGHRHLCPHSPTKGYFTHIHIYQKTDTEPPTDRMNNLLRGISRGAPTVGDETPLEIDPRASHPWSGRRSCRDFTYLTSMTSALRDCLLTRIFFQIQSDLEVMEYSTGHVAPSTLVLLHLLTTNPKTRRQMAVVSPIFYQAP